MPLIEFKPPPGIVHDGTAYSSRGTWNDCDKVRFRGGFPERIGGWSKLTSQTFEGTCRHLFQWVALDDHRHLSVGTNLKYYIEADDTAGLTDITPLRSATLGTDPIAITNTVAEAVITHNSHGLSTNDYVTISGATAVGNIPASELNKTHIITATTSNTYTVATTTAASSTTSGGGSAVVVNASVAFNILLGADPFATTNGSATVTVTHTAHGAYANDFVTFDGASALNNVTIDGEYQIVSVVNANSYTITAATTANATGSGGGSAVLAQYQINTGSADFAAGTGWGSGGWGSYGWGISPTTVSGADRIRIWSAENFGEDLVFNPRGGNIYYYSHDDEVIGKQLNTLPTATANTPTVANWVMADPSAQRIIAFGTNPYGASAQDPLCIRWSDDGDAGNWEISDQTTAGELKLNTGSYIMCAAKARGRILVWTESSLHSLQFVQDYIYGLQLISGNIDIVSPNCVAAVDEMVMWMGRENFFVYTGSVQTMPCPVRDYVFSNINLNQAWKIFASTNRNFREVWWFYPSEDSSEIDRYVVYNYAENVWYYGTLGRTAWSDTGILGVPIAASTDGYIYYHESGLDDGSTTPAAAIEAFVASAPIQLGDGQSFSFVSRIVPDVTFEQSAATEPSVTYTLSAQNYPGAALSTVDGDGGAANQSASAPVEQWTQKIDTRLRGRQFMVNVTSDAAGVFWRLGTQRFDVRQDGRR